MTNDTGEELRARALDAIAKGDIEGGRVCFEKAARLEPEHGEGWIHLALVEKSLGQFERAKGHFDEGLRRLAPEGSFYASTRLAQGGNFEALEESSRAVVCYQSAVEAEPRATAPLESLARLWARTGQLVEADAAITAWCRAAVSSLEEKQNIPAMRAFQKAMRSADSVDPAALLLATREAYVRSFDETRAKLPPGVQLEAEPFHAGAGGQPEPLLPNPARPWARVRFDAVDPTTGRRWMIQESPTYGFPAESPAAVEGCFSVPLKAQVPFPVFVATRTAWDYFFLRIRFAASRTEGTLARCEEHLGRWYERGFSGEWCDAGRGYFHFCSEPFPIDTDGVRYEFDLGLSGLDALGGLFEALIALHAEEPLAEVMIGEGALPAVV